MALYLEKSHCVLTSITLGERIVYVDLTCRVCFRRLTDIVLQNMCEEGGINYK